MIKYVELFSGIGGFRNAADHISKGRQSLTVNGKRTNITTADLLAVAKTVTIKKAAAIIDEVKTAVSNWAEYAAQTNLEERILKGIAKELEGVWALVDVE